MLLRRTEKLPDGDAWCYELKFDGYRALAIKTARKVHLRWSAHEKLWKVVLE